MKISKMMDINSYKDMFFSILCVGHIIKFYECLDDLYHRDEATIDKSIRAEIIGLMPNGVLIREVPGKYTDNAYVSKELICTDYLSSVYREEREYYYKQLQKYLKP